MTPEEWLEKADWEGGVMEAILGYGLTHKDLGDKTTDFYEATKALVEGVEEHLKPLLSAFDEVAEAYEE